MQNKEFNKKWISAFCNVLTEEQIKKAGIGQENGFLWHAFSYGFIACLKGEEARRAYDKADKNCATQAFYEIKDNMKMPSEYVIGKEEPLTENYLTSEQIDKSEKVEIYIIGKDYNWCYIRTHEEFCGPYFCKKL